MKRQATVMALGVLMALATAVPSFAASNAGAAQGAAHRHKATSAYSGYYDAATPEGNYSSYPNSYSTGGLSGAIGGVGR